MEKEGNPTWAYRLKDGEVESRLFETGEVPQGWVDSPAKCQPRKARKAKDGEGA